MVNAQAWLESQEEYNIKEKRNEITELDISKKGLAGSLDLRDFAKLETINCYKNQITSLDVSGLGKLKHLECYDNEIRDLNINDCLNLETLDCIDNQLTELDISDCSKLKTLSFSSNWIIKLETDKLSNLGVLRCSNNKLENLDFLFNLPHPEKLSFLSIWGNNFPTQTLSFLNPFNFTKLEGLLLGSNHFVGDLKPLKKLENLKELDISETDINEDLESLPKNLEKLYLDRWEDYSVNPQWRFRCQIITKKLKGYQEIDGNQRFFYDYKAWREDKEEKDNTQNTSRRHSLNDKLARKVKEREERIIKKKNLLYEPELKYRCYFGPAGCAGKPGREISQPPLWHRIFQRSSSAKLAGRWNFFNWNLCKRYAFFFRINE